MEGIIVTLLAVLVSAQGAIWYKLGKVETQMKVHLNSHQKEE